uniref:Uncharacterized protein n=2 Tax=Caenorhabditis tropicalis TaxID=1561998 RepID=A0A1I7TTM7_9PELO
MEESLMESNKRNEILEERMKNMEEIRSLEERHIPITETIKAACYYLEESSRIIDSFMKNQQKSDREVQKMFKEHVELNQGKLEKLELQLIENSDILSKKIEETEEKTEKTIENHATLRQFVMENRQMLRKLQSQMKENSEVHSKSITESLEEVRKKIKEISNYDHSKQPENTVDEKIQNNSEIGAAVEISMQTQLTGVENQIKQTDGNLNSWIMKFQQRINARNGGNAGAPRIAYSSIRDVS